MAPVPRPGAAAPLGSEWWSGGVFRWWQLVTNEVAPRNLAPLLPPLLDHPDRQVVQQGRPLGGQLLGVEEVGVEAEVWGVVGGSGLQREGGGGGRWARGGWGVAGR